MNKITVTKADTTVIIESEAPVTKELIAAVLDSIADKKQTAPFNGPFGIQPWQEPWKPAPWIPGKDIWYVNDDSVASTRQDVKVNGVPVTVSTERDAHGKTTGRIIFSAV